MSFKKEDLFDALKTLVLPELSKLQATTDRLDTRLSNVEGHLEQIDKRFDQTDKRIDDLRIDTMERFSQVDKRFDQIDQRFSQVDKRFDQIDQRFNQVDRHIMQLENAVGEVRQYVWTSGVYGRTETVRQPMFVNEEPTPYSTKPTIAELKTNPSDENEFLQNDGQQNDSNRPLAE